MLSGSKTMLSVFDDFQRFSTDEGQINRVSSFKHLGVLLDEKWKWKMRVNSLLQNLGHRLSVFNRIYHMLDQKSLTAYFNGLVLPHLDYADIVWGDQPGLTTQMNVYNSFKIALRRRSVKQKCHQLRPWCRCGGSLYTRGGSIVGVVLYKMQWKIASPNISVYSDLPWTNNTVLIPEMATCPKSVGQERNGEEAKRIIKPLTTGPHKQVL